MYRISIEVVCLDNPNNAVLEATVAESLDFWTLFYSNESLPLHPGFEPPAGMLLQQCLRSRHVDPAGASAATAGGYGAGAPVEVAFQCTYSSEVEVGRWILFGGWK